MSSLHSHPQADLLHAIAKGEQVQVLYHDQWEDLEPSKALQMVALRVDATLLRVKPSPIFEYRVALMKGSRYFTIAVDFKHEMLKEEIQARIEDTGFVRWLSDWKEYTTP